MITKISLMAIVSLAGFVASANAGQPKIQGLYDVVAPVLPGDPAADNREVGQIYFNSAESAYKGIDAGGNPVFMSSGTTDQSVVSDGSERVERAFIDNTGSGCTVSSQSGAWLSSCTRNGTGDITITIANSIFSATPACICTINQDAAPRVCTIKGTPSSTSYQFQTHGGGGTFTTAGDMDFNVICMGAR
jgi:hypothetical protein